MSPRTLATVLAALVVTAPALAAVPATAAGVPTGQKYVVVARTSTPSVEVGSGAVRLVGRVRPRAAGEKVHLQQRLPGSRRWTRADTDRLDRKGRFVLVDRPSKAGVRSYRVLKPASDGLRAGRSPAVLVEVLAWERLSDLEPWAGCGLQTGVTVPIGGTSYPASLLFTGYGPGACMPYVVHDLGGRCRTLRATYGHVDGATYPGAVSTVTVSAEGTLREYYRIESGGRSFVDEELDISGVQRLSLGFSGSNIDPAAPLSHVAAGTAQVLCLPRP
jgi:hypothetical protein